MRATVGSLSLPYGMPCRIQRRIKPILVRVGFEPRAAAVRHRADRLGQQQALVGRRGKQPPAAAFFHQVLEIFAPARNPTARA